MMTEARFTTPPPPPPPSASPPPPPPPTPPPPYAAPRYPPGAYTTVEVKRGQSIAALVLGCCSVFLYFTLIVPLLAIVFGGIAIRAQRAAGQKANGMAIAGLVLGIVLLLSGLLLTLMLVST